MDDRSALMAAIIANRDEDTPRLAFADWLDEHGDKHDRARAEFIRCQVAATGEGPDAKTAARRASAIRKSQLKRWLGPLATAETRHVDHTFDRGILAVWMVTPGDFLKRAHQAAVCERFPLLGVDHLILYEPTKRAESLSQSPALAWVSRLTWHDAKLEDGGFVALANSPHLARLSELRIDKPRCTNAGLKALAESTGLGNLHTLELSDGLWRGRFSAAGVRLILDSEKLPKLDDLGLTGPHTSDVTHRTFFTYKSLSRLRVLRLGYGTSLKALARCPHLTNLEELYVCNARIADDDARALSDNPAFGRIKTIVIADMNTYHPPLAADAEKRLRDRFGDRLTLKYSILCRR